ncbi:MAG: hypothetical protein R3Y56_09885 [Akkermansia sp.]
MTETQGAQFESVNISSDASYAINAAQSYTSESSFTGTGTLSLGSSNSAKLTVMGAIDASVSIAVTGQVRLGSNITNNHIINLHSDDDGAESLSLLDGVQVTTGGGQASTAEQQDSYWRNSSVHLGKNALLDENIRLCVSGGSNTIDGSGSMQVKSLLLNGQSAGGATELNIGSGTTVNVLNDFHMTYRAPCKISLNASD